MSFSTAGLIVACWGVGVVAWFHAIRNPPPRPPVVTPVREAHRKLDAGDLEAIASMDHAEMAALLDANGLTKTRLYRPTFRDGHADVRTEAFAPGRRASPLD